MEEHVAPTTDSLNRMEVALSRSVDLEERREVERREEKVRLDELKVARERSNAIKAVSATRMESGKLAEMALKSGVCVMLCF
jgi:hypothetical protein